jgi:NitT/TauT family transport system substrate-binding protein
MPLLRKPDWSRRQALCLLSGAIGSLTLHACGQSSESGSTSSSPSTAASNPTSASLAMVTWIGYSPIYIAKEKGFYQDFGLDLKIQVFNSGSEAIAAFSAGRTDGLSLVPSEAVTVAARGKDYRVVYVIDTSNGGDGILARKSIPDIASFKGKQIAVEKGGVSHFFLLQAMADVGLKESDVTLVNLAPDAAAAAYQAGKVDIAVSYAPFLFTANEGQKDGRIIYDSSMLKTPTAIADLIIFDTAFTQKQPGAIEAFIRGNLKGLDFLKTNPQEGLAIAAKQLGLTPAELEGQLKGVKLADLDSNVQMLSKPDSNLYVLKPMTDLVGFLKNQGQIDKDPSLSSILEPKFVLDVQAKP